MGCSSPCYWPGAAKETNYFLSQAHGSDQLQSREVTDLLQYTYYSSMESVTHGQTFQTVKHNYPLASTTPLVGDKEVHMRSGPYSTAQWACLTHCQSQNKCANTRHRQNSTTLTPSSDKAGEATLALEVSIPLYIYDNMLSMHVFYKIIILN